MITRKIGTNRGKNRIWLEGAVLTDNGIYHGMRFNVISAPNSLVIAIAHDGKRKIAGKPGRPIIDMSAGTIDACEFVSRVVRVDRMKASAGLGLVLTGLPA